MGRAGCTKVCTAVFFSTTWKRRAMMKYLSTSPAMVGPLTVLLVVLWEAFKDLHVKSRRNDNSKIYALESLLTQTTDSCLSLIHGMYIAPALYCWSAANASGLIGSEWIYGFCPGLLITTYKGFVMLFVSAWGLSWG